MAGNPFLDTNPEAYEKVGEMGCPIVKIVERVEVPIRDPAAFNCRIAAV